MQSYQFQVLLARTEMVNVTRKEKTKKILNYANSNESQIFKKKQLKVRIVNVSVTNSVHTESEKTQT